ncbi:MAG: helix-turn-helix transcriptional regulator [Bacilli bacterium]|nr:helix-turn-helix transcriptional regulator [Bacilli bacterium]
MNIKEIIYEKRTEAKLTQEQLAEQLSVARQTISKWETGETVPDLESIKKLATILHFSVDEALGIEPIEEEDDKTEWFIIGGFVIGNALGLMLNNFLLGYVFASIGLGVGYCMNAFKK